MDYDYGARIYDARIGKFLSVDPLTAKFPMLTPYQFAGNTPIIAIDLDGKEPKLVITTEITGWTLETAYGEPGKDGQSLVIAVPTYKMILVDAQDPSKILGTYNVTRDGWYNRGVQDGEHQLTNRHFEPANENQNLYTGTALNYPDENNEAYALRQKGSGSLPADPITKEENSFVDGTPIDDARKDLDQATGVMIHVSGWYLNKVEGEKLGGSYGCFGFIPTEQTYKTKDDARKAYFSGKYKSNGTSNKDFKKVISKVEEVKNKYKGTEKDKVLIEVKKRKNVEKNRTYKAG